MKILRILLSALLTAVAFGAQPTNVQKDASTNNITGNLTFPNGKKLTIGAGATLDATGATLIGLAGAGGLQVSTMAALKATSVATYSTGQLATVLGYTTTGDGGEGVFVYNSVTGGVTDDGGILIRPNAGDGYWLRLGYASTPISPRWFGAKGDGSTDDTVAVQAVFTWLDNHPNVSELPSMGAAYFPKGRYRITGTITIHNAYGLTVTGAGAYATTIEMNTTSATMFYVNSYLHASFSDMGFINTNGGGNSAGSQTTSIGLDLHSDGTGSIAKVSRCVFTNWVHCIKNTGTVSGDSGVYDQVTFRRSTNAWYSDNPMSGIQTFNLCVYDLITLGGINTNGVGTFHVDTPNFVGAGSLFYLRPVFAQWGRASNYIVTNGKMEWTSPSSMWVNMPGTGGTEVYGEGTFTFNSCSMSGGDGGEVTGTDIIMNLCGAVSMRWNGGNYAGTLRYVKNITLSQENPSAGTRSEIIFSGAKVSPDPANIVIFDPSGGASGAAGPVVLWQGCMDKPDLEIGGEIGYNARVAHTIKYGPRVKGALGWDYENQPYLNDINFYGITVKINSVVFVVTSTSGMSAGDRVATVYSDAARTLSLGSVTFTGDAGYYNLPLDLDPTIVSSGKLYLKLAIPEPEGNVYGYWLVNYTCL